MLNALCVALMGMIAEVILVRELLWAVILSAVVYLFVWLWVMSAPWW